MSNDIITYVIGILIALVIVVFIFASLYLSSKDKTPVDEKVQEFLNVLKDKIYMEILQTINVIDFAHLAESKTLAEAEELVLKTIYDTCWSFVEEQAKDASDHSIITQTVLSLITKDTVDKFVNTIIADKVVMARIEDAYTHKNTPSDISDQVYEDIISNTKEYNIEDTENDPELEPLESGKVLSMNSEGIVEEIDRPEDPDLSEDHYDDDSVDFIGEDGLTDEEREAGVHLDSNGRKRDKNGRFTK